MTLKLPFCVWLTFFKLIYLIKRSCFVFDTYLKLLSTNMGNTKDGRQPLDVLKNNSSERLKKNRQKGFSQCCFQRNIFKNFRAVSFQKSCKQAHLLNFINNFASNFKKHEKGELFIETLLISWFTSITYHLL